MLFTIFVAGGAVVAFLNDQIESWLTSQFEKVGTDIKVVDMTEVDDPASNWLLPAGVDPTPYLTRPVTNEPGVVWMREHGAVAVSSMTWEVTLLANRTSAVEIVDIVPVLVEPCGDPLVSGYGFMDEHLEGDTDKLVLVTDVASEHPVFDRTGVDDKGERVDVLNFFADKRITLPKGEKNTIAFTTRITEGHCRWTYRLDYIAETGRESMTISAPGGKPFEMTAGDLTQGYDWIVPTAALACLGIPEGAVRPKLSGTAGRALIENGECWTPR